MSNTNAPFGFRPTNKVPGSGMDFGMSQMLIKGTSTQAVYRGDLLIWDTNNAGYVTANTSPASQTIVGVAWEFSYLQTGQGGASVPWNNYFPGSSSVASGDVTVGVITDPNAVFQAQCGATALAQSDVGANIQVVYNAGNTSSGISGMYLSSASTTTSTLPFQVYRILGSSAQASTITDYSSAYNIVEVVFNNSMLKNTTGR